MLRGLTIIAALAALGSGLTGCKPKAQPPAKTPKEAIVNFSRAIDNADKDAFLRAIDVAPEDMPAAEAMFEMDSAYVDLRGKMVKAYGKDAMSKLGEQFAEVAKNVPTADEVNAKIIIKLDQTKDKKDAVKAEASMPNEKSSTALMKKDGVWKVALFQSDRPTAEKIAKLQAVSKACKAVAAKIGEEDVTPEHLGRELTAEMAKAGYGTTQPATASAPTTQK
jgi:hypothetical protein